MASVFASGPLRSCASIDAAVFDLEVVNHDAINKSDERSPEEIIVSIERQGEIVTLARARLRRLLAEQ